MFVMGAIEIYRWWWWWWWWWRDVVKICDFRPVTHGISEKVQDRATVAIWKVNRSYMFSIMVSFLMTLSNSNYPKLLIYLHILGHPSYRWNGW